jgi:UDP-N-acetylglucosamine acyltransferase
MSNIHPTAIIEDSVKLGNNVYIGPYCYISGNVVLGDDCRLESHISISGDTTIGKNNHFFPFAVIGVIPQDLKFKAENSRLIIGDNNIIREHVTIHLGTEHGGMLTQIGNNCLLMVASHVAHDCRVGNKVILANNVTLAGHVSIGDHAIIGGLSAIQQFVKIGAYAIVGGMSGVENNIIPYGLVMGERASLAGLNLVGLRRNEFSRDDIKALKETYELLFSDDSINLKDRVAKVAEKFADNKTVMRMINFLQEETNKAICQPK